MFNISILHMLVIIAFIISATAVSYVTFKILHSSARVKTAKGEFGGAAAMLIAVLTICLTSYYQLTTSDCPELRKLTATYTVAGTLIPKEPNVSVIVASDETTTGLDGSFRIPTQCIDRGPNSLVRLLILMPDGKVYPVNVYDKNSMTNLKINLPKSTE
jgi:hypothetical protein